MKWGCRQRYYDNGKVEVVVIPVEDTTTWYNSEQLRYDEYLDVFNTKKEAQDFRLQALEA